MNTDPVVNALLNPPKFDLVGPTVDDDIRRAITRYGAEAVKDAVKRQTKPKRGRKPEKDWPELRGAIEADARDLLNGIDPFSVRKNYSIAKAFADKNPGHSHPGTMKRITRKLDEKRLWMALVAAENMSREGYPFAVHIRALEALTEAYPLYGMLLESAQSSIADFEAKMGEPPRAELSMKEVEETARNALFKLNALASPKPRGIFGLLSAPAQSTGDKE